MRLDAQIVESRPPSWKSAAGVFALQIPGLIWAAWVFQDALNPDGIAYLRIASRCARGQFGLAISGHWGPVLSWLMTPLLMAGIPPLAAARAVMAMSAVIFLLGCWRIFSSAMLRGRLFYWGLWTMALLSILWSVEVITPDLLLAGVVLFAFAETLAGAWCRRPGTAFLSGLLWGLAYLIKAVALPLGILTCLGIAVLRWRKSQGTSSQIARGVGLTLAGLLLVAAPWVAVLSRHYGKLTVSNSATFNHLLVGPSVPVPVHLLDQGFRRPEPGQITIWEDPPLPGPEWSPWANWPNALHQMKVMEHNTPIILSILTHISLAFPILAVMVLLWPGKFRTQPDDGANRGWFLLPVAVMAFLFLPNYLMPRELRYFYAAAPLFFVGGAALLMQDWCRLRPLKWRYGAPVLAATLLIPALFRFSYESSQTVLAGECARILAQRITHAGLAAPLAGSGMLPGGRAGLYTAFLLAKPWLGDELSPRPADYKASGADLIVVDRGTRIARELAEDSSFRNLDGLLFSPGEAIQFPLQAFGRK
jgi:hypothetical protein